MDHLLIIHTAPVPSGSSHAIYDLYIDNVKAKDTGKYNCLVGYENEFVKVIIEQSQDAYLTITGKIWSLSSLKTCYSKSCPYSQGRS